MKTLANGIQMPQLGLGVYQMTERDEAVKAMTSALNIGYRAIDTAAVYKNEGHVGEAVRLSEIPREEIFITSKVQNDDQGYDQTLRAFEATLKELNMDYVDLYLTHWPVAETYVDTYRAIERLYDEKLIRATGVSNHHQHHLEEVLKVANVAPMVNQIELHPRLTQLPLRAFCKEQGIAITSWSPLARTTIFAEPTLVHLSKKYKKTVAQLIIRWHLQNDLFVIPKSITPERIAENGNVADFEISLADMEVISALNINERTGPDPDNFNF